MASFTLEGWTLALDQVPLGRIGASHYFNGGFTYYYFEASPVFGDHRSAFDEMNDTWAAWDATDDDDEDARLWQKLEDLERAQAALPLRLISPEGDLDLTHFKVYLHPEDKPPIARFRLSRPAYDKLRAVGRFG